MNLKKTAIALALAGVAAAPLAASADGSVYASARIGFEYVDDGNDSRVDARNYSSRLGMRGETEIGGGWSGWGRYELQVETTGADNSNAVARRHAVVGLKSDHNNIFLGQTYHTWYTHITGVVDRPWWDSRATGISDATRTSDGLTYAGNFGVVDFGITGYFAGDGNARAVAGENVDRLELGLSFNIGSAVRLGFGVLDSADDNVESVGALSLAIDLGLVQLAGAYQSRDDDSSTTLHIDIGNFYGHYGTESVGALDTSGITLGYTLSVGPRTLFWFEAISNDTGNNADDTTILRAALKYDIL